MVDSPESPDNAFDRGDLDMIELEDRNNDSDMEELNGEENGNVEEEGNRGWIVTEGYHPITSPISEEGDKLMGPSKIQRYWTRSQARHSRRGRRKAVIRPMQLQNGRYVTVRRQYRPRQFRLGIRAPVIQTREIIAKVTLADGSCSKETLNHRIFMAKHAQTQTRLLRLYLKIFRHRIFNRILQS